MKLLKPYPILLPALLLVHWCRAQFTPLAVTINPESCNKGYVSISIGDGTGNFNYNWNDGGSGKQRGDLDAGIYSVTIVDQQTAADTTIKIEITRTRCKVRFALVMTPNGDGINDVFYISGLELYPNFHLQLFNRWGQLVHEQENEYIPWDGTSHGVKLPDDSYYYVFFYDGKKKDEYEMGSISIIR